MTEQEAAFIGPLYELLDWVEELARLIYVAFYRCHLQGAG